MSNIILGIDPGSRCTGYGLIHSEKQKIKPIAFGIIRLPEKSLGERLFKIYQKLAEVVQTYQPDTCSIEQVFMHRNVQAALKLGQARGAALVAVSSESIPVVEYSPREIKQALVGYGNAEKKQVQHMAGAILSIREKIPPDAADALAVAICYAHQQRYLEKVKTAEKT